MNKTMACVFFVLSLAIVVTLYAQDRITATADILTLQGASWLGGVCFGQVFIPLIKAWFARRSERLGRAL